MHPPEAGLLCDAEEEKVPLSIETATAATTGATHRNAITDHYV